MKITFLGAVEEVTGSRYFIESEEKKILVDCGFFQGDKKLSARNLEPFPVDPGSIDAVMLTHAHIDHTGYIPALVKNGFKGKIYCTKATYALCSILLVDSGAIQEQDAKRAYGNQDSSSPSTQPLYTAMDATYALSFFHTLDYHEVVNIGKSLTVHLVPAGHILGASCVVLSDGKQTITFSGDLGRPRDPIMKAPSHIKQTDFLVLESTYGDRLHGQGDPIKELGDAIHKTVARGGVVIIPVFAVARAQMILYCLYQLKQQKAIPEIPIFLDSPMAINVTKLYASFSDEHKLSPALCKEIFSVATYTPTVNESKQIDEAHNSSIIVAGSGMADGGRVQHHLQHFISNPKNTVVFVGFQAEGTDGRALVDGAKDIEIYDKVYTVRANIQMIDSLSAHADYSEILEWLGYFECAPKKVFISHGEAASAQSLKKKIEELFGWSVEIPTYLESFDLD